jgi:hypothetical protein
MGYALHRRKWTMDEYGEREPVYDMETPDFVAQPGGEDAVCWQNAGYSSNRGTLSSGAKQEQQGERVREILQGALFSQLEVAEYDRLVIQGKVYELREIQHWPSHRMLYAERVL